MLKPRYRRLVPARRPPQIHSNVHRLCCAADEEVESPVAALKVDARVRLGLDLGEAAVLEVREDKLLVFVVAELDLLVVFSFFFASTFD